MRLQQVLSVTRKAIDDYQMIQEGDKIAVGISGGKDSLTLLYALHGLKRFYPKRFEIHAVTVDLGFDNLNLEKIIALCEELKIPYTIIKTDIAQIVFEDRKESNPCSLCAKMRKGALNQAIKEQGCNKVAYAHHKDDVVETMLLSLIYEGRFHTFSPVTYLDRMELTVIRPLLYMNEMDVIGFVKQNQVPVVKSPCPADGNTKREYVHKLLKQLIQENPGVKERMFTAIQNNMDVWKTVRMLQNETHAD
ncbi:MAG: tRNA 2-thiocytidine(32) synthetase TtcA [Clostridiales bacterium]|nr:tRNA 2-thiocytidine(32) synthetase TtcA [Clostridiales bacterium]